MGAEDIWWRKDQREKQPQVVTGLGGVRGKLIQQAGHKIDKPSEQKGTTRMRVGRDKSKLARRKLLVQVRPKLRKEKGGDSERHAFLQHEKQTEGTTMGVKSKSVNQM